MPLEQLCLCSPIINLDSNNILISNNSDSFFSCCSVAWACFYSSPERINGSRDVTFLCFYRPIIITNPICNMFWSFISMAVGANSQSLLALWYVKIIHTKISGASPGQQLFWCLYPREGQAFRTLIVLCQCVAHFIQHRSLLNSYTAMLPKMYYKWVVSMGITRPAFLEPLSQTYKTVIFRAVSPGSRLSNVCRYKDLILKEGKNITWEFLNFSFHGIIN